ncbi:dipicolinate synthase subunit B [Virgibacillus halodenitrificans]|uniref:Dipicolinate synthase subunit B n=1 Tax=Virgibacillus halodenitrificans TaxID=1482 RepID=A0AAC9NLE2_VIRHA|nr:dipicolinate synthase subunit B [Virgibacillus halodenitrificans]APC48581.1 dipicolinate synthase subunit B [Virgibacillus halodenitrificans]MBD1224216.1 dipicolinate synthase subunit B [Virgibacillus halodenitrificans]MCG1028751.1 dipicolinate synthase subunit B [Virgibacillus halodenitrificans]MCJ0931155.1 dipicolinate synthase subunit B [Virgibacillus halodenitrificans]MEC2161128.1 dipicolinate synthase subunit B [Virgibacillus halodenitrificans]
MSLEGKRIGFGFTGSHCTYDQVFPQLERLMEQKAEVVPIVTYTVRSTDTKFGNAEDHIDKIEKITGKSVISTMQEAEPLGPKYPLDCMVIAPLTGNSLSKMANALTDSPVLMAAKATMRNQSPVVLGISTNDALGLNGVNLMRLMASKFIYFIPYGQDDPHKKPNSLVAKMDLLSETVESALQFKQLQPVIVPHHD